MLPVLLEKGVAVELHSRQIHVEVALMTALGGGQALDQQKGASR